MDVAPLEAAELIGRIHSQELVSTHPRWLLMIVSPDPFSSAPVKFFLRRAVKPLAQAFATHQNPAP